MDEKEKSPCDPHEILQWVVKSTLVACHVITYYDTQLSRNSHLSGELIGEAIAGLSGDESLSHNQGKVSIIESQSWKVWECLGR